MDDISSRPLWASTVASMSFMISIYQSIESPVKAKGKA